MLEFDAFIHNMELVDISLVGQRFMWYRPNSHAKSRLDRFLVSNVWLHMWDACSLHFLDRCLFDHCQLC